MTITETNGSTKNGTKAKEVEAVPRDLMEPPAHHVPLDWHEPRPVKEQEDGRFTVTYRSLPKGNTTSKWFEPNELEEATLFNKARWEQWVDAGRPIPKPYKASGKKSKAKRAPRREKPQIPVAELLPQVGTLVQVSGVILNEDGSASFILRAGERSWLTTFDGLTA